MLNTRIFLIHGWSGSPLGDWMPWAKKELEQKGYEVVAPLMPDPNHPTIESWVNRLSELVGSIRSSDIFIGHSIGCQTILRYLEKADGKVAKVILVAPWFSLTNLDNKEMWEIADPWIKTPIDFAKVKPKSKEFVTMFSNNDSWVPYIENTMAFKQRLNPHIISVHNHGHFTADEGIVELPEILNCI